ncbi:hypothetical protein [Allosphingosinicella sp.]|uniref:hypothetical protein n=1 Tax=Allosphingosinicella sp. TaxID=2823234 RepID=UPI002FC24999
MPALAASREGRPRRQRYPNFWHDLPVREAVIARHRQMTIDQAVAEVTLEFGKERTPSRSAVHRTWKRLDHIPGSPRFSPPNPGQRQSL